MKKLLFLTGLILVTNLAYGQSNNDTNSNRSTNQSSSTTQYMADSKVTLAVKSKLLADRTVKSTGISVTTNNGIVELTGTIPSQEEKLRAEQIVSRVNGVKSVKNNLTVNPDNTNSDTSSSTNTDATIDGNNSYNGQ